MKQFLRFLSISLIFTGLALGLDCLAAEQEGGIPQAPVMEEGHVPGALNYEGLDDLSSDLWDELNKKEKELDQLRLDYNNQMLSIARRIKSITQRMLTLLDEGSEDYKNDQENLSAIMSRIDGLEGHKKEIEEDIESNASITSEEEAEIKEVAALQAGAQIPQAPPLEEENASEEAGAQIPQAPPLEEENASEIPMAYLKAIEAKYRQLDKIDADRAQLRKDRQDIVAKMAEPGAKSSEDLEQWKDSLKEIDKLEEANLREAQSVINVGIQIIKARLASGNIALRKKASQDWLIFRSEYYAYMGRIHSLKFEEKEQKEKEEKSKGQMAEAQAFEEQSEQEAQPEQEEEIKEHAQQEEEQQPEENIYEED